MSRDHLFNKYNGFVSIQEVCIDNNFTGLGKENHSQDCSWGGARNV